MIIPIAVGFDKEHQDEIFEDLILSPDAARALLTFYLNKLDYKESKALVDKYAGTF